MRFRVENLGFRVLRGPVLDLGLKAQSPWPLLWMFGVSEVDFVGELLGGSGRLTLRLQYYLWGWHAKSPNLEED